jgi:type IV fimbrial biogenesis protein FimT
MISKLKGLTLVEIMITLSVMIILIAIALPNFKNFLAANQLKSLSQTFVQDLKWAQNLALKNNTRVYVNVRTGSSWCYGISDSSSSCNCSADTNCTVGGTKKIVSINNFAGTTLAATSPLGSSTLITFEPLRGASDTTGQWTFTNGSQSLGIGINSIGRLTLCSTTITGYSTSC